MKGKNAQNCKKHDKKTARTNLYRLLSVWEKTKRPVLMRQKGVPDVFDPVPCAADHPFAIIPAVVVRDDQLFAVSHVNL